MPHPPYSRQNPSARYRELLDLYRDMHRNGYTRVYRGHPRHTPPESTFPGRELRPYIGLIRKLADRTGARTILDYGAGKAMAHGEAVELEGERFPDLQTCWGIDELRIYEPALPGHDRLPDGPFDGVISTDVLEHIPKEDVPWVVEEMFSLARRFLFATVACVPALARLPSGENAHVTVESPDWWAGLFHAAASKSPCPYSLAALVPKEEGPDGAANVIRWLGTIEVGAARR